MYAWPSPEVPALPGSLRDAGTPLRLYDTAAGRLVETPHDTRPGCPARIYVCGITPYDATHMGHAATYLGFDLVQRAWRDDGHPVTYVQNVTDVDDPLLERAAATGVDWRDLAAGEIKLFIEDMTSLRVLAPQHYMGVVEAMPLVVELIQRLRDRGATYEVDGDIYFSVHSDVTFGSISGLNEDEMRAVFAERGGDPGRPGKKHPLDCLLWQAARPDEPWWPSELGPGRPGWHIECIAIALDKLGMGLDIQGGGSDLVFPHHEMGASEAHVVTGSRPYAHAYVHSGMVGLDGEKMSKSKGNLVLVSKLRAAGADPMAIRLALLDHHYRSDWSWTDEDLRKATARLERWRAAVAPPDGVGAEALLLEIRGRVAEDLDTPGALVAIDAWAERQLAEGGDDPSAPGLVSRAVDALLGVAL